MLRFKTNSENRKNDGEKKLTEYESKKILKKYKIPTPRSYLAKSKKEALKYSRTMKFPIVMKLMSPDILHKSEAGIVKTNICNEKEVLETYDTLIDNALNYENNAKIEGILVEETLKGIELIAGIKKDPVFDYVILLGTGGIYTEILKDTSIRKLPVSIKEIKEMMKELRIYNILKKGYRNIPKTDINKLSNILLNLTNLAKEENIKEMDINPLFVNGNNIIAGDVRIIK